jgi:hypothetical protein
MRHFAKRELSMKRLTILMLAIAVAAAVAAALPSTARHGDDLGAPIFGVR